MSVEINILYEGDLHCRAVHGPSGTELATDAPADNGGRAEAFSPTDLVATALGTCMVTIMGIHARNHNLNIDGTRIRVLKDMIADPVRRIGALTLTITLPEGCLLSDADRQKLRNAADTCPVRKSLHPDVKISVEFEFPR
jgi:putative redox protein